MKKIYGLLLITFLLCGLACRTDKRKADVSGITADVSIQRFEKDLFALHPDSLKETVGALEKKYLSFFPLYIERIMRFGSTADSSREYLDELSSFLKNKAIRGLYDTCQLKFPATREMENSVEDAFRHLKYYYPQWTVPEVFTFISEFGYGVVTADSILGIGLDMYLGENYVYYPSVGFPEFMIRKLKPEYIIPNAVKAIGKDLLERNTGNTLLSQLIYQGKLICFMQFILPGAPDSILTGFTQKQLEWCLDNEGEIWNFFLENQLLYSTDVAGYRKYISDGPTTAGMPRESPGNIGAWVGWRIVSKYMDEHQSVSFTQLIQEQDVQKILTLSRYKPKRKFF